MAKIIPFLVLTAFLSACSSGGSSKSSGGARCPIVYKPSIILDIRNNGKLRKLEKRDTEHPKGLKAGKFEYAGAEFYFRKDAPYYGNKNENIQLHVVHLKNRDGDFVFKVPCVRNLRMDAPLDPMIALAVTEMTVDQDAVEGISYKANKYNFGYDGRKISMEVDSEDNEGINPKEFFFNQNAKANIFVVRKKDYYVRSYINGKYVDPSGVVRDEYMMAIVRFKYVPERALPGPDAEEPEDELTDDEPSE